MKILFSASTILLTAFLSTNAETLVVRLGGNKSAMPVNDNYVKKTVSFQTPEELFAQVKASNFQKALFYLGFNPEFFKGVDDPRIESDYRENFNEVPFDEDLTKPAKIRDARKAYECAVREFARGKKRRCVMSTPLLATMHLEGIGTPKDAAKAVAILEENGFFESVNNYSRAREYFPQLIAYLYYRGLGGISEDKQKALELVKNNADAHKNAWRNFYCGYIVPKDFEFAVFILENIDKAWAAQTLAEIYAGKYSPSDADPEKSAFWRTRQKVLTAASQK